MEKKPRGRPKKKDSMEVWQLGRVAFVMSAYNEARERGEKHSSAVTSAVEFVRRRSPELPISEATVRRILATYQPRGSGTVLRFERSPWSEEEINKYRSMQEQAVAFAEKNGIPLPDLPTFRGTCHPRKL